MTEPDRLSKKDVINGLTHIRNGCESCAACPYISFTHCDTKVLTDAITLLGREV